MASTIQADIGGGVNVTATTGSNGIQYTINLANGSSAGPYTGDELVDVGSGLQTIPPPETFRLTYKGNTVLTSTDPNDLENGQNIVPNLFQIQKYAEEDLAVASPNTTSTATQPTIENSSPTATISPTAETVPEGSTGASTTTCGLTVIVQQTSDPTNPDVSISFPSGFQFYLSQSGTFSDLEIAPDGSSITDTATGQVYSPTDSADIAALACQANNPSALEDAAITAQDNLDTQTPATGASAPETVDPNTDPAVQQQQDAQDAQAGTTATIQNSNAPSSQGSSIGLQGATSKAQESATAQDAANASGKLADWRVAIALAPGSKYLYNAPNPGILAPLAATDGVIFPYTPSISVAYQASYDVANIIHSNYKVYQYTGSSVEQVTITGEFTAQDTYEANYLMAVIHFFRSMTKMFYGQDEYPKPGTPPPVAFLYGFGAFQFDGQPLAITGFTYSLPADVDYIQAYTTSAIAGQQISVPSQGTSQNGRLGTQIQPGGTRPPPGFQVAGAPKAPTYVPTKIQLSISCVPLVSRNQVSNNFSLAEYATGNLTRAQQNGVGGFW